MNYTCTALIFLSFFNFGCSSKNSQPKDYWRLNEPEVHAWDTSSDANVSGFNVLVSDFHSDQIKETLDYPSFLQFSEPTKEINLEILTSCSENSDSKVEFKKTFKFSNASKVYFYSYLPDEVLYEEIDQTNSKTFKCDFNFTATNKINSKHKFTISGLSINTFRKNVLSINSLETKIENPKARTILPNSQRKKLSLPSIYYNQKEHTYLLSKDLEESKLISPGYIKCNGDKNKFFLTSYNNELQTNIIGQVLLEQLNDGTTTFLKKCRVITKIAEDDTSLDIESKDQGNTELRTVWSEYFNVIFEEPKIDVRIESVDNSGDRYPLNKSNYIDRSTHAFDLILTNESNKDVTLRLPSKRTIEAILSPLIYKAQTDEFSSTAQSWNGLNVLESPETFISELKFMSEGQPIAEFVLKPQGQKVINIVVNKNFNCFFNPIQKTEGDHTSERGFRIRAIQLNSEEDTVFFDYKNQGQMETYPEAFSFNSLIESAAKTLNTISSNKNAQKIKTNSLQWNDNRSTAIDTIIFRNLDDIITPKQTDIPRELGQGMFSQTSISELKRQEILETKKPGSHIPKEISFYMTEKTYCTQIY